MKNILILVLLVSSLANAQRITIADNVNIPKGWERVIQNDFHAWIIQQPLSDDYVKTYDGKNVYGLNTIYKVKFDYDIGNEDLHHCADAAIYFNALHKFDNEQYHRITYHFTNGQEFGYLQYLAGYRPKVKQDGSVVIIYTHNQRKPSYKNFRMYLDIIWRYAGTWSVDEYDTYQLKTGWAMPGDIFVKGGFPGHAITVIDVIENIDTGQRKYMFSESYMPAQDQYIVVNTAEHGIRPQLDLWFDIDPKEPLSTSRWTFQPKDLKRFIR